MSGSQAQLPPGRMEDDQLPLATGLAEVDDPVSGMQSFREAGSRDLTEAAVHLRLLMSLKGT